jgi:hypothetical protein
MIRFHNLSLTESVRKNRSMRADRFSATPLRLGLIGDRFNRSVLADLGGDAPSGARLTWIKSDGVVVRPHMRSMVIEFVFSHGRNSAETGR